MILKNIFNANPRILNFKYAFVHLPAGLIFSFTYIYFFLIFKNYSSIITPVGYASNDVAKNFTIFDSCCC